MAPQFVDFNGDGITDIFTATFDGSPWVSLGSKEGFKAPEQVKNSEGARIFLSQYWDYEARKWTSKNMTDAAQGGAHCISAFAWDWDADGDLDIILGDRNGGLWLNLNAGSTKEPKYGTISKRIMSGDKPLELGGKVTSPRLLDWDKDGLDDLLFGTFGDSYGNAEGGGVFWSRNTGKKGEPKFDAPKALIAPAKKDAEGAVRADAGLYFDVIDYDGDGDLDIVVGGYSMWPNTEPAKEGARKAPFNRKPYVWVYLQKSEPKPDTSVR